MHLRINHELDIWEPVPVEPVAALDDQQTAVEACFAQVESWRDEPGRARSAASVEPAPTPPDLPGNGRRSGVNGNRPSPSPAALQRHEVRPAPRPSKNGHAVPAGVLVQPAVAGQKSPRQCQRNGDHDQLLAAALCKLAEQRTELEQRRTSLIQRERELDRRYGRRWRELLQSERELDQRRLTLDEQQQAVEARHSQLNQLAADLDTRAARLDAERQQLEEVRAELNRQQLLLELQSARLQETAEPSAPEAVDERTAEPGDSWPHACQPAEELAEESVVQPGLDDVCDPCEVTLEPGEGEQYDELIDRLVAFHYLKKQRKWYTFWL